MKHLQAAGFSVETRDVKDYDDLPAHQGVPASVRSCHTARIGRFLVEGHVPVQVIEHLLRQRAAKIAGIGVQGMPAGSPGMESPTPVGYDVLAWPTNGRTFIYARVAADGSVTFTR